MNVGELNIDVVEPLEPLYKDTGLCDGLLVVFGV